MSAAPALQVPLFASVRPENGRRYAHHLLMGDDDGGGEAGPFHCRAVAPNGIEAEGALPRLTYQAVREIFSENGVRNLMVDRGFAQVHGDPVYRRVAICAWGGGRPISRMRWSLKDSSVTDGIQGLAIDASRGRGIEQIQLWAEPGPATVTVVPDSATIYPVPGAAEYERRIRSVVVGSSVLSAAYWGFYRHSVHRAAFALGEWLIRQALSDADSIRTEEMVAAAHASLHFRLPQAELTSALAKRLRQCEGIDAAVMVWALEFDELAECSPQQRRSDFESAVTALHGHGCLFTETLRTFIDQCGDGEADWLAERPPADAVDRLQEGLAWIRRLASATYWDTEHLTYRAVDPARPDAAATDRQLDDEAKKKCTWYQPPARGDRA